MHAVHVHVFAHSTFCSYEGRSAKIAVIIFYGETKICMIGVHTPRKIVCSEQNPIEFGNMAASRLLLAFNNVVFAHTPLPSIPMSIEALPHSLAEIYYIGYMYGLLRLSSL